MNVYVGIRTILHSLLFLVNLIALTVAAGVVISLKGGGHKATAGSVLVILATMFYAFIAVGTWSETCIPRSRLSRNRTEAITLPVLFLFEIIAAIVNTAETSKGTCMVESLCVALLVLSWISAVTLLVYYLITMLVLFYHFELHDNLWEETPLSFNWFPVPQKPAVPPKDFIVNPPREITGTPSVEIASAAIPPMGDVREAAGGNAVRDGNAGSGQGAAETFENIPLGLASPMEDREARLSFSVPSWARKLRGARRGVEPPFPIMVPAATFNHRSRDQSLHEIDAPVSPTFFHDIE